ncbi:MAG TPA: hypothetical protein VNW06_02430 [Cytophagaceae bacterium]|jgi:hypothetical protein|nr:hypothetical protein [Cytophagaceae bacterium]
MKTDKAGRYFLNTEGFNTYKGLLNTHVDSLNRKNQLLGAAGYKPLTTIAEVVEFSKHPELFICHQAAVSCGLNSEKIDVLKVFFIAKKPTNYNDLISRLPNSEMVSKVEYVNGKWVAMANVIKEEDFWVYYRNDEQEKAIKALEKALEQMSIVSKYINGRVSFSVIDQIGALSRIDGEKLVVRKEMAINL